LHHQSSNSSFSSSQSSLATPPLSRSSSPGSSTPISRLQTPTSLSSAEDLEDQQRSTPPASVSFMKHKPYTCILKYIYSPICSFAIR
jgi:hypothetical protein